MFLVTSSNGSFSCPPHQKTSRPKAWTQTSSPDAFIGPHIQEIVFNKTNEGLSKVVLGVNETYSKHRAKYSGGWRGIIGLVRRAGYGMHSKPSTRLYGSKAARKTRNSSQTNPTKTTIAPGSCRCSTITSLRHRLRRHASKGCPVCSMVMLPEGFWYSCFLWLMLPWRTRFFPEFRVCGICCPWGTGSGRCCHRPRRPSRCTSSLPQATPSGGRKGRSMRMGMLRPWQRSK